VWDYGDVNRIRVEHYHAFFEPRSLFYSGGQVVYEIPSPRFTLETTTTKKYASGMATPITQDGSVFIVVPS
jgi:hypothetical protein